MALVSAPFHPPKRNPCSKAEANSDSFRSPESCARSSLLQCIVGTCVCAHKLQLNNRALERTSGSRLQLSCRREKGSSAMQRGQPMRVPAAPCAECNRKYIGQEHGFFPGRIRVNHDHVSSRPTTSPVQPTPRIRVNHDHVSSRPATSPVQPTQAMIPFEFLIRDTSEGFDYVHY